MKLYLILIIATLLAKLLDFYVLVFIVLMLPVAFLEKERFGINNYWSLSVFILIPFVYIFGINYTLPIFILAFAEELFFRAYLMKYYSNLTVSAMFVIPHLILYPDLHSFLTFFPSMFFGYIYSKTASLLLSTVFHTLSNIIYEKFLPVLLPEHLENLLKMPVV